MHSASIHTVWSPVHKEIVISHFLHPPLNQVEVGRVGVERVSEVAMVTEGRQGGGEEEGARKGGRGEAKERGRDGRDVSIKYCTVVYQFCAMLHTC